MRIEERMQKFSQTDSGLVATVIGYFRKKDYTGAINAITEKEDSLFNSIKRGIEELKITATITDKTTSTMPPNYPITVPGETVECEISTLGNILANNLELFRLHDMKDEVISAISDELMGD